MRKFLAQLLLLSSVTTTVWAQTSDEVICTLHSSCSRTTFQHEEPVDSTIFNCPNGLFHASRARLEEVVPSSISVNVLSTNGHLRQVRIPNVRQMPYIVLRNTIIRTFFPQDYSAQIPGLQYGDQLTLNTDFGFPPSQQLAPITNEEFTNNGNQCNWTGGPLRAIGAAPGSTPSRVARADSPTNCQYLNDAHLVQSTSASCRTSLCVGSVSCTVSGQNVEGRVYCPILPNGSCPDANACALDESIDSSDAPMTTSQTGGTTTSGAVSQ